MTKSAIALFLIVPVFAALAFSWWITGPERLVQKKPFTPEGLRVIVVDFPGEENIVGYNASLVSYERLQNFSASICGHSDTNLAIINPTWVDRVRGHNRASFICS